MDYKYKRVLVAGMARSGVAAAKVLSQRGAQVLVYDREKDLPSAKEALAGCNISWNLGEDPLTLALSCDLTVISPGIPVNAEWLVSARAAGKEVIGELELGYRLMNSQLIAITGTNGKTTTTTLVGEIFKNAGKLAFLAGNIGNPLCAVVDEARMDDVVVAEISSFQLETTVGFHPIVAAVLNITEDHLNRHGTMDDSIRLKERVFENQSGDDYLVLNWDDEITRGMAQRAKSKVVYFSSKAKPPQGAWVEDGQIFFAMKGEEPKALSGVDEVKIPGDHNLQNALCASAIAMVRDVPPPVIRHTLRSFAGVEHRIESVREFCGVNYINDSKGTNVDASINAVKAMLRPTVLIAGGYDKKTDFAPFAKAISQSKIETVVLIGETAQQIHDSLTAEGFNDVRRAASMHDAVELARSIAKEGYNVLLSPACASFDMFTDYEERGQVFKSIVNALQEDDIGSK